MAEFGPDMTPSRYATSSAGDDFEGLAGGALVWLVQWATIIPGLFALLALTAVAVLPLVVFSLAVAAILAVPYGAWRLVTILTGRAR